MILEETMNPNFNWAIVAERMQALQVEAETVTRTRHAARIRRVTAHTRQLRRSRRVLALVPAGSRR